MFNIVKTDVFGIVIAVHRGFPTMEAAKEVLDDMEKEAVARAKFLTVKRSRLGFEVFFPRQPQTKETFRIAEAVEGFDAAPPINFRTTTASRRVAVGR